jgi:hypothetical protein
VSTVRLTAAAACLAVALAACAGAGYSVPKPKPLPAVSETTAARDLTDVSLAGVPGKTTTSTAVIGPGKATLQGTVAGPDGPLPAASVHLERLVDGGMATLDVPTNPDGTWSAPNILGGRYRVRAFRAPDLALVKPALFFLTATESRALDIKVDRYTGVVAIGSIAPRPPLVGEPANLVVRVAQQSVDNTGVVRSVGVAGANVELVGSGQWRVESPNPTLTDVNGDSFWQVRCRSAGVQQLALLVNGTDTLPLDLPACEDVVTAPSPDESTSSTSFPFRRTTTTR